MGVGGSLSSRKAPPAFFAPVVDNGDGAMTPKLTPPPGESVHGVVFGLLVDPSPRCRVRRLRFEGVEGSL